MAAPKKLTHYESQEALQKNIDLFNKEMTLAIKILAERYNLPYDFAYLNIIGSVKVPGKDVDNFFAGVYEKKPTCSIEQLRPLTKQYTKVIKKTLESFKDELPSEIADKL